MKRVPRPAACWKPCQSVSALCVRGGLVIRSNMAVSGDSQFELQLSKPQGEKTANRETIGAHSELTGSPVDQKPAAGFSTPPPRSRQDSEPRPSPAAAARPVTEQGSGSKPALRRRPPAGSLAAEAVAA